MASTYQMAEDAISDALNKGFNSTPTEAAKAYNKEIQTTFCIFVGNSKNGNGSFGNSLEIGML